MQRILSGKRNHNSSFLFLTNSFCFIDCFFFFVKYDSSELSWPLHFCLSKAANIKVCEIQVYKYSKSVAVCEYLPFFAKNYNFQISEDLETT